MPIDTDSALEAVRTLSGNLVLIASQNGALISAIEGPAEILEPVKESDGTLTVADLWPAEQSAAIRTALKRAVRERSLCCDELERDDGGNTQEVICVPQGPDRVLLIVRDLSEEKDALTRARKLALFDEATGYGWTDEDVSAKGYGWTDGVNAKSLVEDNGTGFILNDD